MYIRDMDDYLTHKYEKAWVLQSELLRLMSMSESTLKRYMADWRKSGKPLAEMGYIKFQGFRETCWQPGVFTRWIIANKLGAEVKYDYDLAEKKKNQMGVINFNKKLKMKEATNGN